MVNSAPLDLIQRGGVHYGDVGEISLGDPEYLWLWPCMSLMLNDLCNAVEGLTRLPTVRRSPSIHEGRTLGWVTG
ncbi:hypothetical protein QFZ82_001623 [Streptomyces sp. V4I23]|uniref:hypothetical protein n=1 Tax=Streptomyces sp. V4I23 TaxID=3042282 RepID=UPI002787954B|nr:hypothetical protein [Streptomyces sp. V4I23]MDQ1007138.1 hypothetical protein [Streptomyces sp. V4I23]